MQSINKAIGWLMKAVIYGTEEGKKEVLKHCAAVCITVKQAAGNENEDKEGCDVENQGSRNR